MKILKKHTGEERLVISLRNHGTQVRDNIEQTTIKVHNTTNLEK